MLGVISEQTEESKTCTTRHTDSKLALTAHEHKLNFTLFISFINISGRAEENKNPSPIFMIGEGSNMQVSDYCSMQAKVP